MSFQIIKDVATNRVYGPYTHNPEPKAGQTKRDITNTEYATINTLRTQSPNKPIVDAPGGLRVMTAAEIDAILPTEKRYVQRVRAETQRRVDDVMSPIVRELREIQHLTLLEKRVAGGTLTGAENTQLNNIKALETRVLNIVAYGQNLESQPVTTDIQNAAWPT